MKNQNIPETLLAWAGIIALIFFYAILIFLQEQVKSIAFLYAGFITLSLGIGLLFYVVYQYQRLLRDEELRWLRGKLEETKVENGQLKKVKGQLSKEVKDLNAWKADREQHRYQKQLLFDFIDKTKVKTEIKTASDKIETRIIEQVPKELIEDFKIRLDQILEKTNELPKDSNPE